MGRLNVSKGVWSGAKYTWGLAAVFCCSMAAQGAAASDGDRPRSVRDTAREPEEVVVTTVPPREGAIPTAEFMQQVYSARGIGSCLYAKGRPEQAFPYLNAAARKGFKMARLGYLYQAGLGVERDTYMAMASYGIAATGTTLPVIRNWYNGAWRSISEEHRPAIAAFVDVESSWRAATG